MNALVNAYRKRVPNDPRSDDELTGLFGQQNDVDGRYNGYPDFIADLQRIRPPAAPADDIPLAAEFRRGVSRGATSLKSSGVGLGALAAGVVGADKLSDTLAQKYHDMEQESAEINAPGVDKVEDIRSVEDAARYALGKGGELVPQIGEAMAFGAAGAVAGTMGAPGPGTVAGGAAGVLEGFLGRQGAKAALKALLKRGEDIIANKAKRELVQGQLEKIVRREAVGALDDTAKALLKTEVKAIAQKYGANAANIVNFYGQGAGSIYGGLANTEGVKDEDARTAAILGGIGSAIANAPLPASVASKFFPGAAHEVADKYVKRLLINAAEEIPIGAGGEFADELVSIAAEKYADPAKRDKGLSDADLSRLLNASVIGAMAGGVAAPASSIPGPRKFDPTIEPYIKNVTQDRRTQIDALKGRVEGNATPSQEDLTAIRTLTPDERSYYAVATPAVETVSEEDELPDSTTGPAPAAAAGAPPVAAPASPAQQGESFWSGATDNGREKLLGSRTDLKRDWKDLSDEEKATVLRNSGVTKPANDTAEQLQAKRAAAAVSIAPKDDPLVTAAKSRVKAAEAQTNPNPTIQQRLTGVYAKGKLAGSVVGLPGLEISIENPLGSERDGVGTDGKPWTVQMPATYGYFLGTVGKDKDHVDVSIGPNPTVSTVYVVDQINPETGEFDESKTFVGFESQAQATAAYDASFSDGSGPKRRGAVTAMTNDDFKTWVKSDKTKQAVAYEKPVKKSEEKPAQVKETPVNPEVEKSKNVNQTKPAETETPKTEGAADTAAEPAAAPVPKPVLRPEEFVDVESRGVERKSARGRKVNAAAVAAWEVERSQIGGLPEWKDLTPEHREHFIENHPELRKEIQDAIPPTEKAWFVPAANEPYPALAKRLLSDSSPAKGEARNSMTYRVTALLDKLTGKVHLVSTFENNKEAKVTRFTDAVPTTGRAKGLSLRKVLDVKSSNAGKVTQQRFEVLGSARTKELTEYFHHEFPDRATFDKEFAGPLESRQREVAATAAAVESAVQAQKAQVKEGRAAEVETKEPEKEPAPVAQDEEVDEDEEAVGEASVGPEFEHEPEPINLEPAEVKILAEQMPEMMVDDLADMIAAKAVSPELLMVIKKIAVADPAFFGRSETIGTVKALKEYGYKIEADPGKGKPVEQGGPERSGPDIPNAPREVAAGAGRPAAAVASREDSAGEPGPESDEGDQEPAEAGDLKFNLPDDNAIQDDESLRSRQGGRSAQIDRTLDSIHEAAARAGIKVEAVRGALKGGAYSKATRTLIQVIGETVGAQDVKTALHEVAHDVFANEDADVRDRLLRAVDRISDEALGVDTSSDPRIRSSDPSNLGKQAVNEERLVEATAGRLMDEGFDPEQAKGFAQRFVRALKDFYLRSAMAVQRMLGFKENPDLALRYFENRVKRLLAGDTSRQSYFDFVGAGTPSVGQRYAQWFGGQRERLSHDGRVEYDHVPDLSLAAARFNTDNLLFSLPSTDPKYSRTVEIEKRAAVLNHQADLIKQAAQLVMEDPALAKLVTDSEKTPERWVSDLLAIPNPELMKQQLEGSKELDGSAVAYDPAKTIADFKAKSNEDAVLSRAYLNSQGLLSKLGKSKGRAMETLDTLHDRLKVLGARQAAATAKLAEFEAIKSDPVKEVKGIDAQIKRQKVRLAVAKRDFKRATRHIAAAQRKITVINKMMPALSREQARLAGLVQIGAETVFGHGMPYNVPNAEGKLAVKKLNLSSLGEVTNPLEVEADLRSMATFLHDREAKAAAGDETALDSVYQGVRRQFQEIAANKNFKVRVGPAERFMLELSVSPVGKRMADAFGTPAARVIDRLINQFTDTLNSMRQEAERIGRVNDQLEDEVLKLTPGVDRDWLRDNILNPAKALMKRQHDLEETFAGQPDRLRRAIYGRVREHILETQGAYVRAKIDQFMPRLEKLLEHQWRANQWQLAQVEKSGLSVLDPKFKAFNPATGKTEEAVRRHLNVGAYTFSQKLGRGFGIMVDALRNSDWASFGDAIKGIGELYEEDGPDAARAAVERFFKQGDHADQVQNDFFKAIAEMDTESPFAAPGSDEEVSPADPMNTKQAYKESGGDVIGFAERLYDLQTEGVEGVTQTKAQFVEQTLGRLNEIFNEINNVWSKVEPDGHDRIVSIRGMSPDALINARSIEHLPGSWFDYHSFDQRDMLKMSERIASQTAFGRGQERLAAAFDTVAKEVLTAQNTIQKATAEIKRVNPSVQPKEIEKQLAMRFGKEAYATLKAQVSRAVHLRKSVKDLSDYFRKDNSPDASLNAWVRASQQLGNMLVNQPSSAIYQLAALFDIQLRYGASGSTVKATLSAVKEVGKELVASLGQAVGLEMFNGSEYHRRYVDLGLTDATAVKRWHDAFDRLQGEGRTTQFFRGLNDLMGFGLNRLGDKAEHAVLRPMQPFVTSAIAANKALTEGMWRLTGSHVMRGMEFYKTHADKLADPDFKLSAEAMRLKGAAKDSFTRLTADMDRWGLNFDDMVRGSLSRADKTLFTDQEAMRLYSMMLAEVSSEASISTMPLGAYNNSIVRFATPLLGWSFRRMQQVGALRLNEEGQTDMKALARGLGGLAAVSLGGLAISALVDEYYKQLLGKQRNLRPIIGAPNAQELALGVMENLNRVGTLGLMGELFNTAVNVGGGGDNRIISVDQRVVALSALQSVLQATSSWINQGQADYSRVVRPLASALGGGGMLQYMQMANQAFGFNNPESRVTARINAQNYLRVVGRQLDMEVRTFSGGYSAPTPLSPSLTRMELAAYGNDPVAFQEAYDEAKQRAKDEGYPDPIDHVKRAYTARNPLKSVFRAAPTAGEYARILSTLPEDGRRDVSEAVSLFNEYAERIGAREFEGRKEKAAKLDFKAPKYTPDAARNRAVEAIFAR